MTFTLPNPQTLDDKFWQRYNQHLQNNYKHSTIQTHKCYSRKFSHILNDGNAQELLTLSNHKRLMVMSALDSLSKFMGCYDLWESIKKRYHLKWSYNDGLSFFNAITNGDTLDSMLKWVKDTISILPKPDANILIYCTVTGLRPTEACQSIELIQTDLDNYLNKDSMMLEHFKYAELFIRKTKHAFVSIIDDSIIELAQNTSQRSYNSVRMLLRKQGIEMHMAYCRKIFATYLRNNGIQPEIIDLLQGRVPKSVFLRHYYRPNMISDEIKPCIFKLQQLLTIN
ncbi:MAG: hypothetical protein COA77_02160 [Thaumarchaeota archaeon]|nr:MAG: hypothetical protein COA77_02160 [Nitrososphaerota archaeon]